MRRRMAGLRSKSIPTLLAGLAIPASPVLLRSQGVTLERSRLLSAPGQVVLPHSQEYVLRSRINGRTYRILVSLPPQYRDSPSDTTRYPVLCLLDGDLEAR